MLTWALRDCTSAPLTLFSLWVRSEQGWRSRPTCTRIISMFSVTVCFWLLDTWQGSLVRGEQI